MKRSHKNKVFDIIGVKILKKMINASTNNRNELILKVLFGTGLRISELCNLITKDLDLDNGKGTVRKGKGNKDRLFYYNHELAKDIELFIDKMS